MLHTDTHTIVSKLGKVVFCCLSEQNGYDDKSDEASPGLMVQTGLADSKHVKAQLTFRCLSHPGLVNICSNNLTQGRFTKSIEDKGFDDVCI